MIRLIAITGLTLLTTLPASAQDGRVLTLRDAIDRAAAASPQRAIAQAELDASNARRKGALSGMGPRVQADFHDARYDREVTVPFGGANVTVRPDSMREGSISVSQPITGIYTSYAQAAAARSQQDVREFGLELSKVDAAFHVADAYLAAQQSDEFVRIAKSSLLATDSQVKDASALSQSGRIIRSDLLKINIAQQDAKAQLARTQAEQKKAHDYLFYLVGLSAGESMNLEPLAPPQAVQNLNLPARDSALEQATAQRLELKQAASQVQVATQGEHLTRLKYLPNVDVFMKWDRVYSEPTLGTTPFARSVGVSASWDIWDNGSRHFAHDEAAAETRKANVALQDSKEHVRLEIDDLMADFTAAKEAFAAAQAAMDQAVEAYRLDKARFASGLVTATDLLLSESLSTKAQGALVASQVTMNRLFIALQHAMGAAKPESTTL